MEEEIIGKCYIGVIDVYFLLIVGVRKISLILYQVRLCQ